MSNRYLDGLDFGRGPATRLFAVALWLSLSATLVPLFLDMDRWIVAVFGVTSTVIVFAMILSNRHGGEVAQGLELAGLDRLRGDFDGALVRYRELASHRLPAHSRALILLGLGECAEAAGEFREAAEVFARGEGLLRTGRRTMATNQLLPLLGARRAFALAACGLVEPALAALRSTEHEDGFPQAVALVSRAALLIDTKLGRFADVRDRVSRERAIHRNAFGGRDRAFVRAVSTYARRKLTGEDVRTTTPSAEAKAWILRAASECAEAMQ